MDENKMAIVPPTTPFRNKFSRATPKYAAGDRVLCNRCTGFHGTVDKQAWTVAVFPRAPIKTEPVYRIRWDAPHGPDGKHSTWHAEADISLLIRDTASTTVDDRHCASCGGEIHDTGTRTLSVIEWEPEARMNILRAVVCGTDCLADWLKFVAEIG